MPWTRKGKMFKAIETGDLAAVTRLVEDGYNISDSSYGRQPLLSAVYHGKKDIVEYLIRKGANFVDYYREDHMTNGWQTLLHVAVAQGHKDIALLLIESDKYDRTLINKKDGDQNTALHVAAMMGSKEMVKLLLDNGFNPETTGAGGKLPVGFANQGGHKEVVDLLLGFKRAQAVKTIPAAPEQPKQITADEKWKLTSESCVAQVLDMKDLGYKITEVFNFASRERIRIVNNLKTKADHVETTPFTALPDRAQLQEAFNALKSLGGKADAAVLEEKTGKPRLPHPAQGGGQ